jgi:hypothetical protein
MVMIAGASSSFPGYPLGGIPFKSPVCNSYKNRCLQISLSKLVTVKFFFLKGLWVLMGKSPGFWPGLFDLVSSIAG